MFINQETLQQLSSKELIERLGTSQYQGLSVAEALARLKKYGLNDIELVKNINLLTIATNQFRSPIAWLLIVAGLVSFFMGDMMEMYAILAVVIINALIGGITEYKAFKSMDALRSISIVSSKVIRDGQELSIPSNQLVVGDIVVLTDGDIVSADLCLIESTQCQADESLLTGESLPVSKQEHTVEPHKTNTHPDSDSNNKEKLHSLLFKGTSILRGHGKGLVIATGAKTELGKISRLITHAKSNRNHLEERVKALSSQLIKLTFFLILIITLVGLFRAESNFLLIKTAIALAVAAIPEGMLIVTTLALAQSMLKMVKKNVLIERLSAIETLGATTLIMTDKTGTMTENKMLATEVLMEHKNHSLLKSKGESASDYLQDSNLFAQLVLVSCLCNNATLGSDTDKKKEDDGSEIGMGDPIEIALLTLGKQHQAKAFQQKNSYQRVQEQPFSADIRMMATVMQKNDKAESFLYAIKGAPESVIEKCHAYQTEQQAISLNEEGRTRWLKQISQLAAQGLRVLAIAFKKSNRSTDEPFADLVLLGVVGFEDPLRPDVPGSITCCKQAGIKVKMVTGDNGLTAEHIAKQAHLLDKQDKGAITGAQLEKLDINDPAVSESTVVFSRVSPQQKYQLVELYQSQGHIVGMTGDGVNDGPALKKADIGIAMGVRGTQVARQASDIVLLNDAFPSIVQAISEGRTIFINIRKFVLYLLSCNLSELLIVFVAVASGFPIPLLPLQILFLNLVTDVFPALALGTCSSSDNLLKVPPRSPKEPIMTKAHWVLISIQALIISAISLGAFFICLYFLKLSTLESTTVTFLTLAITQVLHVFNTYDWQGSFFNNEVTRNKHIWYAINLCLFLILASVYLPVLSDVLHLSLKSHWLWTLIFALSSFVLVANQGLKAHFKRLEQSVALTKKSV